jgi:hypothetical protein
MEITRVSRLSGKQHTLDLPITPAELDRWDAGGEYVQVVFPNLSPGQREFLMTGITPEEWAATFPEPADENG